MGAAVVVAAIAGSAAVLLSDDETVGRQAALQVIPSRSTGTDSTRYATAARLTLVGAVTKPGATPATSGSPSWLEVLGGTPAPLVRAYPQQVADGPRIGEADRVEFLGTPVATGEANLGLRPCPAR